MIGKGGLSLHGGRRKVRGTDIRVNIDLASFLDRGAS